MTTFTTQDRQDAQRTPLTEEEILRMADKIVINDRTLRNFSIDFARAIERAHGIGE